MKKTELKQVIENCWDEKESINSGNKNLTKTITVTMKNKKYEE